MYFLDCFCIESSVNFIAKSNLKLQISMTISLVSVDFSQENCLKYPNSKLTFL